MKTLHSINIWSYSITLLLYLTIYLGMLAQILLGIIQLVMFCFLIFNSKNVPLTTKKRLSIYGSLVIIYGLISILVKDLSSTNDIYMLFWTLIPMLLASFFVFITYKLKKELI
ncbi:hypothetical protein ABN763_09860 [Spongiivirga sp. MCCC 1A20706]|uniref:hypothetical protein n=1 Tax=Spongiivirga sp. MCCC 1A20706 TaxID=3160963 RepID=UPI003977BDFC